MVAAGPAARCGVEEPRGLSCDIFRGFAGSFGCAPPRIPRKTPTATRRSAQDDKFFDRAPVAAASLWRFLRLGEEFVDHERAAEFQINLRARR